MVEQMPGWRARLDDPWGISWRAINAVRGLSPTTILRFLRAYAAGAGFERPVFVIGAPRSGTTMVFHLLQESSRLASLGYEGHNMWRAYHHPRYSGWRSDAIGPGRVGFGERRFVNAYMHAHATKRPPPGRFVEKTPCNTLRVPYLLELYPDARFVVVHRDPCNVVNSLIEGWRHPRGLFRNYYVPEKLSIPGYTHHWRWCFTLIEGWRELKTATVPTIAFAQWAQFVEAIAVARRTVPGAQWLEVHLEHLLSEPRATAARIYDHIGIDDEPVLAAKLDDLVRHPVNALTPPGAAKWRRNEADIAPLLPRLAELAAAIGYHVDPATGRVELATQRRET